MANNVSIATKPDVYSTFRYISNKVWSALAEYVDNSLQSYMDHRDELSQECVSVTINMDFENDTIVIEDDAYGIAESNYQRAFELANIPLDNRGLNEFGMGMKVSSVWLSNTWKVETSALGENKLKTVVFDLEEVVNNGEHELPVQEEDYPTGSHFTRITLTNLSTNKPTNRQLSYIRKHLTSIYTHFLRSGVLRLVINGDPLEYKELAILRAPRYNSPGGESILWKKEIDFSFGEQYSIKGFVALLETMSTSQDNGFLLLRRGRAIGGGNDERYRPKELCGQEGSPLYKRLFGELHLEGFNVSFTKNSFQEDDNFAAVMEMLREVIASDKEMDILAQGQHYVKPKTQKERKKIAAEVVATVARSFKQATPVAPLPTVTPPSSQPEETSNEEITALTDNVMNDNTVSVSLQNGETIQLTIRQGEGTNGLYTLLVNEDGSYVTTINTNNHIFQMFADSLSSADGVRQLAYMIKVLVASELSLLRSGEARTASFFRNTFNKLVGII